MAREHAEVITAGRWMVPVFGASTVAAGLLVATGIALASGLGTAIVVVAAIVATMAMASIGFFLWGRFVGFRWHFTR